MILPIHLFRSLSFVDPHFSCTDSPFESLTVAKFAPVKPKLRTSAPPSKLLSATLLKRALLTTILPSVNLGSPDILKESLALPVGPHSHRFVLRPLSLVSRQSVHFPLGCNGNIDHSLSRSWHPIADSLAHSWKRGKRARRLCMCGRENQTRITAVPKERNRETMLLTMKDEGKHNAEKEIILPKGSSMKLLTLPTILTLGRVVAIPILLFVFYSKEWWATAAVATIFVLAAITDWLDGYLARKMGTSSAFGAFLDPVADKLMVATTLVLLCTKPPSAWFTTAPWLIPLPATAIIGREITMSAVREWAAAQGEDLRAAVAVNNLGKWKTALQMVALTILLATRDGSQNGLALPFGVVGVGLLYISAGLALWSLAVYVKGIWGAFIK